MITVFHIIVFGLSAVLIFGLLFLLYKQKDSGNQPNNHPNNQPNNQPNNHHSGISPPIVKIAANGRGMFPKIDYSNIKTLEDIAHRVEGSIPTKFKTFYQSYLTDQGDLIKFITNTANNQDWSPDPSDLKNKIKNGEAYLTLQQIAYILANFLLGNNIKQQTIVTRPVGSNKTFYSGGDSTFQLSSYFTAMYYWMQEKDLDSIIVCFAVITNTDSDKPPINPNGSSTVSYKCLNSLADYPVNTIRIAYGASNPGGSYLNDTDQGPSAQEESAFKMYPELAVGMFILPNIAGDISTDPKKGWLVMGTRTYNELLPANSSITREIGKPKQINAFGILHNYKMATSGVLGISARTCNGGQGKKCNAGKGCGDCWRDDPNDLNLLYGRAAPCFNINKWPKTLSKIANDWNLSETWKMLGGRWGSGAWGCNPSYSLMIQGLAACNGNWRDLTLCGTSQETAGGKCVCQKSGIWDNNVYKQVYEALNKNFDSSLWNCLN